MQLILGGANGNFLQNIIEQATNHIDRGLKVTERVDAAVAFATDDKLLFSWCWDHKIPLRFYGRFDEGVPINISILATFLSHRSPNYVCRLVRHFHPKIIWLRGFGAYIGSANLTQSAWWRNFEAGVFISDEELEAGGYSLELENLFQKIHSHSSPLTDELYELIRKRAVDLAQLNARDRSSAIGFTSNDFVQPWGGLGHISARKAAEQRRDAFLAEWNSTLQILRDLSDKVSLPQNRPIWISEKAPKGAQADQFLHGYYYQKTFDGRRADYESFFQRAKSDPDHATNEAIRWWKQLPSAPTFEDRALNEWAPFLQSMLTRERLMKISEDEFVDVLSKIHASIEYARRVSNKAVGLKENASYTMPEKINALARRMYRRTNGGPAPLETLQIVLYGGPDDELPSRIWDALTDDKLRIEKLGISALGEIVGWALPDKYPPRNGRTSKALRALGYDVAVHV